ncbi:hypothetical protein LTR27_004026 [Elasticomyces elasticus]|nr:hypothetical protein LTR27_004026 [Elasticomyces elasticus]
MSPTYREHTGTDTTSSKPFVRHLRICQQHVEDLVVGLRAFVQHAWFRRVWVKQEVWAAEDLVVMCADFVISWDDLVAAYDWIEELGQSWPPLTTYRWGLEAFLRPSAAERLRLTLRELPDPGGHGVADLVTVLSRMAGSKCSDPRDHVYGILGMTATNLTIDRAPHFTVDYHKSVSKVFQDVVRYVVARDHDLDILLLDGTYGGIIAGQQLPSWCPDFSTVRKSRARRSRSSTLNPQRVRNPGCIAHGRQYYQWKAFISLLWDNLP